MKHTKLRVGLLVTCLAFMAMYLKSLYLKSLVRPARLW